MTIRYFLLSGAAAFSIVTGAAVFSPAMAQKGALLGPVSDWAVSKANGQNGDYCTLARRFKQNVILTIAQNQGAGSTLAIDFQRSLLQPQQPTRLVLDPGAGQQRSYNVTPISTRALVTKIGNEDSFFSALQKTGFLRVEVGERSYSFNLSDIDTGRGKLDSCLSSVAPPVPAISPAPLMNAGASVPSAPMQSQAQSREIQNLRSQIASLTRDNQTLSQRLSVAEREQVSSDLLPLPVAPQVPVAAPSPDLSQIKALSAQIARLNSDNERLQQQLVSAQSEAARGQGAVQAAAAQSGQDIARLTGENQELRAALSAAKAQQQQVSALLEQERGKVRGAQAQQGAMAGLQDDLIALRTENAQLHSALAAAQSGQRQAGLLLEQERGRVRASQDQSNAISVLQSDLDKLKAENRVQAQKIVEMAAQSVELSQLRAERDSLAREKMALEGRLASSAAEYEMAAQLQAKLDILEQDNARLNAQLLGARGASEQDVASAQALVAENNALRSSLEQSKQMLAQMQAETDRQVVADVEAERSGFRNQLAQKEQEIARLASENETLKAQVREQTLQASLQEEAKERARLEAEALAAEQARLAQIAAEENAQREAEMVAAAKAVQEEVPEAVMPPAEEVIAAEIASASEEIVEEVPQQIVKQRVPGSRPHTVDLLAMHDTRAAEKEAEILPAPVVEEPEIIEDTSGPGVVVEVEEPQEPVVEEALVAATAQTYEDVQVLSPAQAQELSMKRQIQAQSQAETEESRLAEAPVAEEPQSLNQQEEVMPPAEEVIAAEVAETIEDATPDFPPAVENVAASEVGVYRSQQPVPVLLSSANVPAGAVELVDKVSGPQLAVYRWSAQGAYGSAEQKPIAAPEQFDDLVLDYIERTQARCPGEFAVVPDGTRDIGGQRVDTYDVACVASNVSSSAALLFFNQGGTFTVMAHEVPTDLLGNALDSRDRLVSALKL